MSAIVYIADSNMLEMHRLNSHREMNFWRLNSEVNFTNFDSGDLLFFLSKNKKHNRKKEKGIIGFGIAKRFDVKTVNEMWYKYKKFNGFNTKEEFIEAITKLSKDHVLPEKISSIYLSDVTFFQVPIYLSDCGMKISQYAESYTYLDEDGQTVFKILDKAKGHEDIWSFNDIDFDALQIEVILSAIYDKIAIKDLHNINKTNRELNKFLEENQTYKRIKNSKCEAYKLNDNNLEIVFSTLYLKNKTEAYRTLIGQANMYKIYLDKLYPYDLNVSFRVIDENSNLNKFLNR